MHGAPIYIYGVRDRFPPSDSRGSTRGARRTGVGRGHVVSNTSHNQFFTCRLRYTPRHPHPSLSLSSAPWHSETKSHIPFLFFRTCQQKGRRLHQQMGAVITHLSLPRAPHSMLRQALAPASRIRQPATRLTRGRQAAAASVVSVARSMPVPARPDPAAAAPAPAPARPRHRRTAYGTAGTAWHPAG